MGAIGLVSVSLSSRGGNLRLSSPIGNIIELMSYTHNPMETIVLTDTQIYTLVNTALLVILTLLRLFWNKNNPKLDDLLQQMIILWKDHQDVKRRLGALQGSAPSRGYPLKGAPTTTI